MIARRARGLRIEGRQFVEDFRFFRRRQIPPPDFVDVARAAGIHEKRAGVRERVLERKMDLVGSAGDLADGAHRRMDHHDVPPHDAERAEVRRQSGAIPHGRFR